MIRRKFQINQQKMTACIEEKIRKTSDFSSDTQVEETVEIFKSTQEKIQPRILYQKVSFKNKGEIKNFFQIKAERIQH